LLREPSVTQVSPVLTLYRNVSGGWTQGRTSFRGYLSFANGFTFFCTQVMAGSSKWFHMVCSFVVSLACGRGRVDLAFGADHALGVAGSLGMELYLFICS
jgi:hypothetical protein